MANALSTDPYELTMLAGCCQARLAARATFELYVRDLPPGRNYLLADSTRGSQTLDDEERREVH